MAISTMYAETDPKSDNKIFSNATTSIPIPKQHRYIRVKTGTVRTEMLIEEL
jgi:hypothetical protein